MKKKHNLKRLLNLNFVDLTNQTYLLGDYDMPYVKCPSCVDVDYIALYSETRNYHKTRNTCVCFYQYDSAFDGIGGIFNAIYYGNKSLLAKYKKRLTGVKYMIAPDYSQCGDVPRIENLYRLFKARIVSNWLLLECDILVIPNVSYANEDYFDVMLDGMEETEVVSFSVKGSLNNAAEKTLLLKAIKYTIDGLLNLKKIVVYSVCVDDFVVKKLFEYPISKGIEIVIPSNLLKTRNLYRKSEVIIDGENH